MSLNKLHINDSNNSLQIVLIIYENKLCKLLLPQYQVIGHFSFVIDQLFLYLWQKKNHKNILKIYGFK